MKLCKNALYASIFLLRKKIDRNEFKNLIVAK